MIKNLILYALLLPSLWVQLKKWVHIYQLSSYQNGPFLKHLKERRGEVFAFRRVFPMALALVACALSLPLLCAGSSALFVFCNPERPAKKPLVLTYRVKRMLACAFALSLTCVLCPPLMPVLCIMAPFLLMASTFLMSPVEKAVSRHYIKDAVRIRNSSPGLKVIGITGSYGKTSTKYFLNELLSVEYNVYMTPGNYNTTLGVTRAIREGLLPTHEIFLCEMGARHVGDIKELCRLFTPDMGIVTAIGPQHLQTFGSQENITKEKLELYNAVKDKGGAFLNTDSPIIAAGSYDGNVTFYGTAEGCDYRGSDIEVGPFGSRFTVTAPDGKAVAFETKLLGRANVQNILGAIAVSHSLGISLERLVPAVRGLKSVPHRLCLTGGAGGLWYIDDAYNSNPEGAKAALDTLFMAKDMTRIMLTPGLVELGSREGELNSELGQYAASRCDIAVLVDGRRGVHIKAGLLKAGFDPQRIIERKDLSGGLAYVRGLEGRRMVLLLNDLPDNY